MLILAPRRCSTGHKGKFGHEFLEFEFRPDGKLRYANNSNYKGDNMIRKEGDRTPSRSLAALNSSKSRSTVRDSADD